MKTWQEVAKELMYHTMEADKVLFVLEDEVISEGNAWRTLAQVCIAIAIDKETMN